MRTDTSTKNNGRKLRSGWKACAAGSLLLEYFSDPKQLCREFEKTFKDDRAVRVGLKSIETDKGPEKIVVKHEWYNKGIRQFFRSLHSSRAMRNFKNAHRLEQNGIPTARPLAALERRRLGRVREWIYVTEYIDEGFAVDEFLRKQLNGSASEVYAVKKELGGRFAEIFAAMYDASMWHRDPKMTNFLIHKDGGNYAISLVDLDGIKRCRLRRGKYAFQTLCKFGMKMSVLKQVTATDYLRNFKIYANLIELKETNRRDMFRRLVREARRLGAKKRGE